MEDTTLMTFDDYVQLSDKDKSVLMLRASATGKIRTTEELRTAILQYVHVMNLKGHAVRMMSLNQKFLRAGQRLGVSVIEVATALVDEEQFEIVHRGKDLLVSTALLRERREVEAALPIEIRPPKAFAEYLADEAR